MQHDTSCLTERPVFKMMHMRQMSMRLDAREALLCLQEDAYATARSQKPMRFTSTENS